MDDLLQFEQLVVLAIPASLMAWLCASEARKLENCLLDMRETIFLDLAKNA